MFGDNLCIYCNLKFLNQNPKDCGALNINSEVDGLSCIHRANFSCSNLLPRIVHDVDSIVLIL